MEHEGYCFKTDVVKNSSDPVFNETFEVPILEVDNPGGIKLKVLDWDRFTKDDAVGECELTAEEIREMLAPEYRGEEVRKAYKPLLKPGTSDPLPKDASLQLKWTVLEASGAALARASVSEDTSSGKSKRKIQMGAFQQGSFKQ